ncbi:MAG: DUF4397 domain-containing protein [Polyangiales bacterium]
MALRFTRLGTGSTLACMALVAAGCSTPPPPADAGDAASNPDTSAPEASVPDASSMDGSAPDASAADASAADASADAAPSDAGAGMVRVRVAHLSPNAPAVDFCVRPNGSASYGMPVLRGLGLTDGLAFTRVTAYLSLPAAQYQVRLVAPNAANCDSSLAGLPDYTLPALPGGATATVAAVGLVGAMGATAFNVVPVVDDAAAPGAMETKVRFVHASPGTPAVDVGVLAMNAFTPLAPFSNVSFPNASAMSVTVPSGTVTVAARATGTMPMAGQYPLQLDNLALPAGRNVTVFAVGQLTSDQWPLAALVCVDGTATNNLTDCTLLPQRIFARVAHLSPNAPAVDFCVRPAGTTAFTGPVLESRGLSAGLSFANVTGYLALAPGQWQVRLVAATATDCNTSLAGLPEYTLPNLSAGTWATVAASGSVGGSGSTAFDLRPFVDTRAPIAAGRANIRFVHASPGTPAVDVGVLSGANFTPIWTNTAFPTFTGAMGADANGYISAMPLMNATLAVRVSGMTANALTLNNVSIAAGDQVSVFAIGLAGMTTGDQRLSALVCQDRRDAAMGLAPCARLP